jgi:hypothetical protein
MPGKRRCRPGCWIWPERAMAIKSRSWGGPRQRACAKLQYASFDGAFAGTIICKNLINADYRVTMFNAGTVNTRRECPELADICKNLLGKCEFVSAKIPVKYNRRFDNNHEFWHRYGKLSLYINRVAIRGAIPAECRRAKSGSKNISQAAKSAGTSLREVEIWVAGAVAIAYCATKAGSTLRRT